MPTKNKMLRMLALAAALTGASLLAQAATPAPATARAPAQAKAKDIHALMTRYHALGQLDGSVLVAEHGKVVYQHAFGLANREWQIAHTTDTAFRIASLTKQFTATLIMQLVEQGKLRLDDPIGKYVPDLRPDIGAAVTLHQLLNHTSGIVDYANFPGFWHDRLGERVSRAGMLAIMNRDLEFTPGTQGRYNSSGYTLLGYVIEKQTGKTFQQALESMILTPLGMRRSGYDAPGTILARRASGYARSLGKYQAAAPVWMPNLFAGGAMFSTVGDLLLWDRALYGTTLLSAQSKQLMFTSYIKDDVWGDLGYGYGWLVGQRSIGGKARQVHEHGGNGNGFRTLITRFPDEQRLVVIFLNEGTGNKTPDIYKIRSSITDVLYGVAAPLPTASLADGLIEAIGRDGLAQTIAALPKLRARYPAPADPAELNKLAQAYAKEQRLDVAVAIIELNLKQFPQDSNSYDAMGEFKHLQGDREAAISNFRRAVALDPNNSYAAGMLRKLSGQ
jgi:CubicO group peptidase (beta-lactamase class C family)